MSEYDVQCLDLEAIQITDRVQQRVASDVGVVLEYAEAMQDGSVFPPVIVFYDGEHYVLADGFHRLRAIVKNGEQTVQAEIHTGSEREAVLYACRANAGLQRSNNDKRRAVQTLLKDDEWKQWSDREIGKRCRVDHKFVGNVRRALTGDIPSEEKTLRTYLTKYGTPATMRTDNISQRDTAAIDTEYVDLTPTSPATPVPAGAEPTQALAPHPTQDPPDHEHAAHAGHVLGTIKATAQALKKECGHTTKTIHPLAKPEPTLRELWDCADVDTRNDFLLSVEALTLQQDPRRSPTIRIREAMRQVTRKDVTSAYLAALTHLPIPRVSQIVFELKKQERIKEGQKRKSSTGKKGDA